MDDQFSKEMNRRNKVYFDSLSGKPYPTIAVMGYSFLSLAH